MSEQPHAQLRHAALLIAGAVLWGTTGTAQALGPEAATPLSVGALRLTVGGGLLVAWPAWRRQPLLGGQNLRAILPAAAAGAVGVAAYQLTFFAAVDQAGVALGTAVAIGSSPVTAGLLEWALTRRRPAGRWWVATAIASFGVVVLAGPSRLVPAGVALALGAGASYAVYALAAKRLIDVGLPSATAMAWVFGLGGVLLMPVVVGADTAWAATPAGLGLVAWLAVATILAAYLLYGAGLAGLTVSTAATLSLAEPLTAAILGVLVVGERPGPGGVAGGLAILAGLVLLLRGRSAAQPFSP